MKKWILFLSVVLFFLLAVPISKRALAVDTGFQCDITKYDITGEYTRQGPGPQTACETGDCEVSRLQITHANFLFSCWPQGKTPEDTSCPGRCTGVHPNFSCQQTGCTPVIGSFNNICTGCEVPATTASCGNPCNGPGDCPSTCGICDKDTLTGTKYCRVSPPSHGFGGPTIPVYDPGCGRGGDTGVKTALGCLPVSPQAFINTITPWAIFGGAGLAFLLGVYGSFMIVISAGNPEKMQAGKELITSAFGGLLLMIFSVFLLKFIGVDILKLFSP